MNKLLSIKITSILILKSEDYALLMRAMLCFMVLAAVMVLT